MPVSAVADSDRPSSQRPENDGRGSCGFYIVAVLVWEAVAILVSNQRSLAEGAYTALAVIPPIRGLHVGLRRHSVVGNRFK